MKAYLVGFVNKQTLKIDHAGIFSEPYPTCRTDRVAPVVLFECDDVGGTYDSAHRALKAAIASNDLFFDWIRPLLDKR
jgi:hypothetical protein